MNRASGAQTARANESSFDAHSAEGGKTPSMLGGKEGVTDDAYRNMMVLLSVATAFEVIETELSLEVLIDSLGTPALLD